MVDCVPHDKKAAMRQLENELRTVLRRARRVDPQGREVRRYVSAKINGRNLWGEFGQTSVEFAMEHFRQNERHIRNRIAAHEALRQSWNDNHRPTDCPEIGKPLFDSDSESEAA